VNAMIRDIMVANPHGVKKEALVEALEQRVPPVPDYMMEEIMEGLDSIALKEQRESEIAWYEQERALAFNKLMKIYLAEDYSTSVEESIISLITNHGNLNDNYYLANRYLEQGNISNAFTVLTNLPNQFVMDSEQEIEHQDYLTLYTMVSNIMQQGKPMDSLDNTSRQVLYQMAEHDSRPAIMAQNILQHIDSASYPEVYILPVSGPVLRKYTAENPDYITELDQEKIFSVYPNPCNDYFIMEYYFERIPGQASYSISDPSGRIIEEGLIEGQQNQLIRRTSFYSSGFYTIKLIINGKVEKVLKLNVIK
ncbi:MAG: T9SS type A sorting domain-containing protein, partial [Bacteroidales bacterium]